MARFQITASIEIEAPKASEALTKATNLFKSKGINASFGTIVLNLTANRLEDTKSSKRL